MKLCLLFFCGIALATVKGSDETLAAYPANLQRLASWMTGSFSSEEQAAQDTDYVDVRLHMVRIWKDRPDGYWLYVEQAVAWSLDKPYRQRIYQLTQLTDDLFLSRVYEIVEPLRFAGT